MYNRAGVNAYAQVGLESAVLSASPYQLVVMLFEGATSALKKAEILMDQGDIAGKGQAISKAVNIITNGLQAGLDHSVNSELTGNLDSLYDYMVRRLLEANLRNNKQALTEVQGLLEGIADAWNQINPSAGLTQDMP
ncbi:flagellar export chaperone FliS [uncultured Cedecea sp.]|uniref:flagellar export chaperone FliS n=1 Tax=uncultured Cedecea sp. TaxID=988762 RepID=UPI00260CAFF2|nr:flagellar export chaperone FliS [uncultured Cedecea sp.]